MRTFRLISIITLKPIEKDFYSLIGVKKYIEENSLTANDFVINEYLNGKFVIYCNAKHIAETEILNLTESIKDFNIY